MENPATSTSAPGNPPYKWMGEPKQRGTFGILSLCFSTMIICIWSALHFNIPSKRYSATRRFFIQVPWMFLALLAPEILLFLATNERIMAGAWLKKVLRHNPRLAKPGMLDRLYHWIYAPRHLSYKFIKEMPQPYFGLVQAYYAVMGGFAFYESDDEDMTKSTFEILTSTHCVVETPTIETLVYIMEQFPLIIITDITEEEILDRAASSSLSKALLIVQVAWFCTNCASRLFQRLPLSLLEVTTAAHAFCTLLIYFVWWSKPLNVAAPTLLRGKGARKVYELLKCSDSEYEEALEIARRRECSMPTRLPNSENSEKIVLAASVLQRVLRNRNPTRPPHSRRFHSRDGMLVPGAYRVESPDADFSLPTAIAILPMLYGLAHFLAWNHQFPTPQERVLWRVSTCVVTCPGLVSVFLVWSRKWLGWRFDFRDLTIDTLWGFIFLVVVLPASVLASVFLIVESVRQLVFLDDAAYQIPAWSNYWPHFS